MDIRIKQNNMTIAVVMLLALTFLFVTQMSDFKFGINAIVPGISTAAALRGLWKTLVAVRAGRSLKYALTFVVGWGLVSFVVWTIGESLIIYLLEHNITRLAGW